MDCVLYTAGGQNSKRCVTYPLFHFHIRVQKLMFAYKGLATGAYHLAFRKPHWSTILGLYMIFFKCPVSGPYRCQYISAWLCAVWSASTSSVSAGHLCTSPLQRPPSPHSETQQMLYAHTQAHLHMNSHIQYCCHSLYSHAIQWKRIKALTRTLLMGCWSTFGLSISLRLMG